MFVVRRIDRLGKDLKHPAAIVDELHIRGIGLRVLADAGAEIDSATAIERELIAERTRGGLRQGAPGQPSPEDGRDDARHGRSRCQYA